MENEADLVSAISNAVKESFCDEAIVESYIEGREISIETISWKGRHQILQYTDKVTTEAPHFVEKAHHQPGLLSSLEKSKICESVMRSLDALDITHGASHTELRLDSEGNPYIIEVGARMGGDCIGSDLVFLSTGYDFVKAVIEVSTGSFEPSTVSTTSCSGIHYIFPKPGILKGVIFKGDEFVVAHDVLVPMESLITEVSDSSKRAAYYIYKSDQRLEFDPSQLMLITE